MARFPYLAAVNASLVPPNASVAPPSAPPTFGPLASGYAPADAGAPMPPPPAIHVPSEAMPPGPGPITAHDEPVIRVEDEPVTKVAAPEPIPAPNRPPPNMGRPDMGAGLFDVQARQVGASGVRPAAEVATRGPKVSGLLQRANQEEAGGYADAYEMRQRQAEREASVWADEEQRRLDHATVLEATQKKNAMARESAAQAYNDQIEKMSKDIKLKEDDGSMTVAMFLSALPFFRGLGKTLVAHMDRQREQDLQVQKLNHQMGLDRNDARARAFDMAVRNGGSIEAAEAQYRAAWNNANAASIEKMAAQKGGAEANAKALEIAAKYRAEAHREAAAGFAYQQARATGPKYQVAVGGQVLPGLMSGPEANKVLLEHGVKPQQAMGQEAFKGQIDILKEGAKGTTVADDKVQNELRWAADKLEKIAAARSAAAQARTAIQNAPAGGIELAARESPIPNRLINTVAGEEALQREQAYANYRDSAMKALYGNVTEGEMSRANQKYNAAASNQARLNAIAIDEKQLDAQYKETLAAITPEARARLTAGHDAVKGVGAGDVPESFKPKGSQSKPTADEDAAASFERVKALSKKQGK